MRLSKARLKDCAFVLASFFLTLYLGVSAIKANPERIPQFYQQEFVPAVMQVCGHGFVNIAPESRPKTLQDFLLTYSTDFNCRDIPKEFSVHTLNQFQRVHRYLLGFFEIVWAITGVSWKYVKAIAALLLALNSIAVYVLLRVLFGSALSALLTIVFFSSPFQLWYPIDLRDYSKSLFIFACFAILAFLLKKNLSTRRHISALFVLGLFIGLGIGFRMDLITYLPLVLATTAAIAIRWKRNLIFSLPVYSLSFIGGVLLTSFPIFSSMSDGSNSMHVIGLGLADTYTSKLSISNDRYTILPRYNDADMATVIRTHSLRSTDGQLDPIYGTTSYDIAGKRFLVDAAKKFPADMIARAIGSFTGTLTLAFSPFSSRIGFADESFQALVKNRQAIFELVHPTVVYLALIVALSAAFANNAALGAACLMWTMFLCTYPLLQFDLRHYFFVEIVGYICVAFLLVICFKSLRRLFASLVYGIRHKHLRPSYSVIIGMPKKPLVFSFAAILLVGGLEFLWKHLAISQGRDLYAELSSIPVSSSSKSFDIRQSDNGTWTLSTGLELNQENKYKVNYLRVTLSSDTCSSPQGTVRFQFAASNSYYDPTHERSYNLTRAREAYIFTPVYQIKGVPFVGIQGNQEPLKCISNIAVLDPPSTMPILPYAIVYSDDRILEPHRLVLAGGIPPKP